jgi:Vanadium chloroperoxidase N-terminal domain/PAP2 superfamily
MSDSILFWNAAALEADRIAHTDPDKREQNGPTLSSRALAIVHLAMYDAFAAVDGTLPTYAPPPLPVPPGATAPDAVAGAAHATLSALYRTQRPFFDAYLSCFNPNSQSFQFGQAVGNNILQLRANDMDGRDCGYMPSPKRGRHRVDPDNPSQGFYSPFYGAQMRGFAISIRHGLAAPPFNNGTDSGYRAALRDVRARGIRPDLTATLPPNLFNDRRTGLETLTGIYWGYDGSNRLGTPPRLYNQIIRRVAMIQGNTEHDNARLFAFVNAAMADAGILAWQHKYCFDFWRPVVGIREHDETLGPLAPHGGVHLPFNEGDPGWLPLGAPSTNSVGMKNFTPNFPAYPSGHATFGAAAFHITRMFYGVDPHDKNQDDLFPEFFVSDEFNGGNRDNNGTVRPRHTRFFPRGLWGMIIENALSRVLLGVHWIFDAFDFKEQGDRLVADLDDENIGGVGLGLRIARDVFSFGGGVAPKMTPLGTAEPPIVTPPPKSPMPAVPAQPAEVPGCAGPAMPLGVQPAPQGAVQEAFPAQTPQAEGGAGQSPVQGAWPSGISQK